jgi:hypothetical protein
MGHECQQKYEVMDLLSYRYRDTYDSERPETCLTQGDRSIDTYPRERKSK